MFDTNGYRNIAEGLDLASTRAKIQSLRNCESSVGIIALAHPIVIQELVTHLADHSDPHFENCLNSLVALHDHTYSPPEIAEGILLFADAESAVCNVLFGKIPNQHAHFHKVICSLVAHIAKNASSITDQRAVEQIKIIAQAHSRSETAWVDGMKAVVQRYDPRGSTEWELGKDDPSTQRKVRDFFQSDEFRLLLSAALVAIHASLLNITPSKDEFAELAETVKYHFGTPLRLLSRIITKMATKGGYTLEHHKEKRANYLWDFQLCFAIGGEHEIGSCDMRCISDDKRIREAAAEEGCPNRAITLESYLQEVGFQNAQIS